jgi:hypothetical protein
VDGDRFIGDMRPCKEGARPRFSKYFTVVVDELASSNRCFDSSAQLATL